jgi:hypothetical protein
VFSRRLTVEIELDGERRPCPLDWLDSFCMRRFTGEAAFDDTLPRADGLLEAGARVDAARLADDMGDWLAKKKAGGRPVRVLIRENAAQ